MRRLYPYLLQSSSFMTTRCHSFSRTIPTRTVLTKKEEETLIQLIRAEHYTGEQQGGALAADETATAMKEAARMEVKWLTDWALSKTGTDASTEQVANEVKKAVLERVDHHKPLSFIIGNQPFYGIEVVCRPPLLIPRPETEEIVHFISSKVIPRRKDDDVNEVNRFKVLDLCCGTGCIGLALAKKHHTIEVLAADVDPIAVQTASENAILNEVISRHRSVESDMFDGLSQQQPDGDNFFDLIVSNPPYILPEQYHQLPRSVKDWEGALCLTGDGKHGPEQGYYREIMENGAAFVRREAWSRTFDTDLVLEVGLQAERVATMFDQSPKWKDVGLHMDMNQQPRWVTASIK